MTAMPDRDIGKLQGEMEIAISAVKQLSDRVNNLAAMINHHEGRMQDLERVSNGLDRIADAIEHYNRVVEKMNEGTNNTSTINIGNYDPKWIAVIIAIICGVIAYLVYVGGWAHHEGDAEPPAPVEVGDIIRPPMPPNQEQGADK